MVGSAGPTMDCAMTSTQARQRNVRHLRARVPSTEWRDRVRRIRAKSGDRAAGMRRAQRHLRSERSWMRTDFRHASSSSTERARLAVGLQNRPETSRRQMAEVENWVFDILDSRQDIHMHSLLPRGAQQRSVSWSHHRDSGLPPQRRAHIQARPGCCKLRERRDVSVCKVAKTAISTEAAFKRSTRGGGRRECPGHTAVRQQYCEGDVCLR
jgi:hypothetical protein